MLLHQAQKIPGFIVGRGLLHRHHCKHRFTLYAILVTSPHAFSSDPYEKHCTLGFFFCSNCKSYEDAVSSGTATKLRKDSRHFCCTEDTSFTSTSATIIENASDEEYGSSAVGNICSSMEEEREEAV
jgi:hypothetical protein